MNILVIGNGFDLAHGLPTKYADFLEFVKQFEELYEREKQNKLDLYMERISTKENTIKSIILDLFQSKYSNSTLSNDTEVYTAKKLIEELHNLIQDNNWIEYFLQCDMYNKENWIDFESEISEVIQSIDKSMGQGNFYSIIIRLENEFLNNKYTNHVPEYLQATAEEQEKIRKPEITYQKLKDILLGDLDKLIRVLEIYLAGFVEKMEISKISKDIKELDINRVISFNYTDTYERLYGTYKIDYAYIHGKADISNNIESNNIVLGIDEYLDDNRKNKDVEFLAFKKYYQRIHKETGCKYKEWVDEIEKDYLKYQSELKRISKFKSYKEAKKELTNVRKYKSHKLYIFGHSLDITDKDILREFILNDNVYTTIFYHDKDVMGQQIANLVKVIGQDELIKRTGGSMKTIEFRKQKDMVKTKNV